MWLFDLTSTECFLPQSRDPETGKIKRPYPIMPGEWRDQFGMSVSEHAASTQVDLNDGFEAPEMQERKEEEGKSAEGGAVVTEPAVNEENMKEGTA